MESSHSVQSLTATFTVIECPRIHLRIRRRNVREIAELKDVDSRTERLLHRERRIKHAALLSSTAR